MNEGEKDLIVELHREAVRRYLEEERRQRALVEMVHRQAVEEYQEKQRRANELIDRLHHAAVEAAGQRPVMPAEAPTIHYTELREANPDSPLYREWNVYRREAGRLLAQGHAGRYVLIKGEDILGLWETEAEALRNGYQRFLGEAFLVHQVQERERVLRCVSVRSCPSIRIPYRLAS
jgi:hypothetical protein